MKKILLLAALCATCLFSCKSKMDSAIDDMDSFVTKWEHKVASQKITDDDKKEFKQEATDLSAKYKDLQSQAASLTPQQRAKIMTLGQRMSTLMMNGNLIDISIP